MVSYRIEEIYFNFISEYILIVAYHISQISENIIYTPQMEVRLQRQLTYLPDESEAVQGRFR